jgi:hypothetical protein
VLPRFRYAMEVGAVDWTNPPKLSPVAPTLKVTFTRPLTSSVSILLVVVADCGCLQDCIAIT